jgi:hypothetical protein
VKSYVYKITFEEVPHFYFGLRSHKDPYNDFYTGSPKTHRAYWDIYTPKKQILAILESREEAGQIERELICQNWGSKYCLNENCGGVLSRDSNIKGGKKAAKRIHDLRANDPEFDSRFRKAASETAIKLHERRASDPEFAERLKEAHAKGAKRLHCSRGYDLELDSMLRETSRRNALKLRDMRRNDPELDARLRNISVANGKRNLGRKQINKGGKIRAVLPHELESFLADGWKLGRK